jgi:hypothetical protein
MLLIINVLYIVLKRSKMIFETQIFMVLLIKIENMVIYKNKFTSLERGKVRKCDPDSDGNL